MNDDAIDMDLSPRAPVGPAASGRKKRNWVPLLVLGLVVIAGGVIVTQFLTQAVDYYCNVDEVGVKDGCDVGRNIRIQGVVQEGTVEPLNGPQGARHALPDPAVRAVADDRVADGLHVGA